jgi:glycolate dehydrogenase iron-sulfur subunit
MIAKELKEEVYKCIKCGICLTPCPVYNLLRFEGASPRGRVQLIKKILEGKTELSENFQSLLFTCLLCETCTANCPSGLQTDRLMKAMRSEIQERLGTDWQKRMLGNFLRDKRRLPFFLFCERTRENLFSSQERKSGLPADFEFPRPGSKALRQQVPEVNPVPEPKGKVLYFTGCATNYFYPNVGKAVIKVLNRLGMEVILPRGQMCCGLPLFQAGGRKKALKNIRENLKLFNRKDVDAVVVDCAACGAALKKEYAFILEEMGKDAKPAKELAGKVMDISQLLARSDLGKWLKPVPVRVTYHDPCHLGRSQGVREEPRDLLKRVPQLELVEMAGAEVCCGGGAALPWEHPDVASGISRNKVQSIRETRATVVASGCPWCRRQIGENLGQDSIRVLHPVELIAEALGDT